MVFPVDGSPRIRTFPEGIDLLVDTEFRIESQRFCSGEEGRDPSAIRRDFKPDFKPGTRAACGGTCVGILLGSGHVRLKFKSKLDWKASVAPHSAAMRGFWIQFTRPVT